MGAYSAKRSGGDLLSGVVVGGVVGGITGYAGTEAGTFLKGTLGGGKFAHVLGGIVQGGIMGSGGGAAAGYGGGVGDWNSIWRGTYRGAAIGGALGGALGYFEPTATSPTGDVISRGIKDGIRDGIKNAAKQGDIGALFTNVAKEVGKNLSRPALDFLASHPEIGYSVISSGAGIEQIDRYGEQYFQDNGVQVKHRIEF